MNEFISHNNPLSYWLISLKIVNCPCWLQFLIPKLSVCILLSLWGSFWYHIFTFITRVICDPRFSIACNILCSLWLHSKIENERIACWITAGPEQKTYCFVHAHSENMILSFLWLFSLSLSTINKRNMNFISGESQLQFPPKRLWCEGTRIWIFPAGVGC